MFNEELNRGCALEDMKMRLMFSIHQSTRKHVLSWIRGKYYCCCADYVINMVFVLVEGKITKDVCDVTPHVITCSV